MSKIINKPAKYSTCRPGTLTFDTLLEERKLERIKSQCSRPTRGIFGGIINYFTHINLAV